MAAAEKGNQNKASTPAPNDTHASGQPAGPPVTGTPQTGTLPGAAAAAGQNAERYDPMEASGSEPPVKSGRGSGQMRDDANAGDPNSGPSSSQAGPLSGESGQAMQQQRQGQQPQKPGQERSPQQHAEGKPARFGVRSDGGGDITLRELAGLVRDFVAAVNGRDFWTAFRIAGQIVSAVGDVGNSQFTTDRRAGVSADESGEFDRACQEFAKCKGDAIAFAPQMHNAAWHRSGGPASGAAQPVAPKMAGVHLASEDLMTLLEIVQRAIDLIHKFRQ